MSEEMNNVKINGTQEIRNALNDKEKFPLGLETPAQEIISFLKSKGIDVTPQLVNNVKFRIRKMKADKKAVVKKKKNKRVKVPVSQVQTEFDQMLEVKSFAERVGGLDKLHDLVSKMRQIAA